MSDTGIKTWLTSKVRAAKLLAGEYRLRISKSDYFDFIGDRAATNRRLRSLIDSRYRISTQIYLAFGGAVVLTVSASLVGWFSFDRVGNLQNRVNEGSVPEMTAAFGIAQNANTLVSAGPRLAAATGATDFEVVAKDIADANVALVGELALLQGQHAADRRFSRMRGYVDSLISNTHVIQTDMVQSFPGEVRLDILRNDIAQLDRELTAAFVPAADDQLFYAMTGYRAVDAPPAPREEHLSEAELSRYRHLAALVADSNLATQILTSAFGVSDSAALEPLRERFESAIGRMEHTLSQLDDFDPGVEIDPMIARLSHFGSGEQGAFELLVRKYRLMERRNDLLSQNRAVAVDLLSEVDVFVDLANSSVQSTAVATEDAVFTGKILLAALSIVSVGGALLIAWLFIGRVLLSRLGVLLGSMRRMADGDLEVEVDTTGRDEVADMADALEVFRQASLDALELDEVRRLNEELEKTNVELANTVGQRDGALEDLHRAQDQIVARDKLAALGEVTAGVAHEIRNPLNFVKNFAEGSDEILSELKDMLEAARERLTEEQRMLILEVSDELSDSLVRIQTHSDRADRIVSDMLKMSRGGSDLQMTDINSLIDEHARLAFHSARAVDPDFQLDLVQDLDPEVGSLDVIPQDLGRVIVNLVTNAGYATNEKRLSIGQTTFGLGSYMPTVWLTSRRGEDHVEIRIRDNGSGIPNDLVDSIFNPFFSTKPPDQGTGLGLALCTDIIREHGGSIRVDTVVGEYTEMIIEIPIRQHEAVVQSATSMTC